MPVPLPSHDFYAHHSPLGAFASFMLGRCGRGGGFGLELSGAADQDVYIAAARHGQPVRAFPFYTEAQGGEAGAYTGETAGGTSSQTWRPFDVSDITRTMGWASDSWTAGDLTFRLLTPFAPLPELDSLGDGELRRHLCPALLGEIGLDNTAHDEDAYLFFGIGAADALRPLSDNEAGLGIACETRWGFAVLPEDIHKRGDVRELLSWQTHEAFADVFTQDIPLHRLANRGGLVLRVPGGEHRTYTMSLGFYRGGIATSGIAASYLYAQLFPDLEAVLSCGLRHADVFKKIVRDRDAELDAAPLSPARKLLLAHATHSYHASTMLLHDEKGAVPRAPFSVQASLYRPLWVVNEGEYRMLNTFDLTVDHAFWELKYHPWTLRNTLDLFVSRYSYNDDTQDATDAARPRFPGGISFTHDMGVANQFTPRGLSSYEREHLEGCFSFMTHEQLCNWCLCAAMYGLPDTKENRKGDALWLASRRTILRDCLRSLINRDGPGILRNGIMSFDAVRCGRGQEITTYDSLDASLGQARSNAYLAVKTWASYLSLSRCFDALGEDGLAAEAEEQAARCAESVTGHWNEEQGYFPAIFEDGSTASEARIVPAIEGLIYPHFLGDTEAVSPDGPYGELITMLKRHLEGILVSGSCLDEQSGGVRLSSTSSNTWMSKIFLSQFVAENILGVPLPEGLDDAHLRWQTEGECQNFAFTDQVESSSGRDLGSRFYPRGVTASLWLRALRPVSHPAA